MHSRCCPESAAVIDLAGLMGGDSSEAAEAIFGYGTIRGDYDEENGDRWGVIRTTGAEWHMGFIRGFRLYQDRKRPFPFAVHTGREEDVLHGTVVTWPGGADAVSKGMNMAERFEMKMSEVDGYSRVCGRAFPEDASKDQAGILAVVFCLRMSAKELGKCHYFSSGDWMRPVPTVIERTFSVEAMFTYGRFRGDFDGSSIIGGGTWVEALAVGFKLYKHPDTTYPFAVYTGGEDDVLHGTLITWPGSLESVEALHNMSQLEGIDEANPGEGTYRRTVTKVSWPAIRGGHAVASAFIYYQEWPVEHLSTCEFLEDGDWLQSHIAR